MDDDELLMSKLTRRVYNSITQGVHSTHNTHGQTNLGKLLKKVIMSIFLNILFTIFAINISYSHNVIMDILKSCIVYN